MAKSMNIKLSILERINDAKHILFGKFSNTLTKDIKIQEWKKICTYCKAVGVISMQKEYTYVRDVVWSNMKRATLAKRDNANQTGSGGGKKFTPIDAKVMEIIGKDSPIVQGLGVQDTVEDNTGSAEPITDPLSSPPNEDPDDRRRATRRQRDVKMNDNKDEKLKRRKLELQVDCLTMQKYKIQLEIFEIEKRLNMAHSNFTRGLASQHGQEGTSSNGEETQSVYIIMSNENTDSDHSEK